MTILTALWLYVLASFVLMLAVKVWARVTGRQCRPVGTTSCLGVGVFIDRAHGRVSIFPLPCIGLLVEQNRLKQWIKQNAV